MKFINQIVALLKKLGVKIDPGLLALILIGIPLLIALVVAFMRWRESRKAAQQLKGGGEGSTIPVEAPPSIAPRALLSVWERFVQALPGEFRRAIADFQPFVVLGPALSGKTGLVQSFTDCQRQQNQFLDSAVEDPNLQIFLGSSVVVQELSASLLKDTSAAARKALTRLWTRSFGNTPAPIVVVPVRLTELSRTPPEMLTSLAEVIRGKVNLLSLVLEKRIEVRVALTQLDEIPGYGDFVDFAQKSRLDLSLPIDGAGPRYVFDGQIAQKLQAYERFLSLALTRLPSSQFRGILSFLQGAPEHLDPLVRFLDALFAVDALSKAPIAGPVYLTSSAQRGLGASPFAARLLEASGRRRNPLLLHEVAALLLVAIPLGYFASGYYLERKLWLEADHTLTTYAPAAMAELDEQRARAQVARFTQRETSGRAVSWFPSFFRSADPQINERLANRIRTDRILAGLKRASGEEWAHLRTLYFMGLVYASRDNELGTLVLSNVRGWSSATNLPEGMIRDYVQSSLETWDGEIPQEDLPSVITISSKEKEERWVLFLRSLQRGVERGVYDSLEFQQLTLDAQRILDDVQQTQALVDRFAEAPRVFAMLMRTAQAAGKHKKRYDDFFREFAPTPEYRARLKSQESVLTRVVKAQLPVPPPTPDTLERLTRKLKLAIEQPLDNSPPVAFVALGEPIAFDPQAWSKVVRASIIRRHVFTFIGQNAQNPYGVFFPPGTELDPIVMNPRNDGTAIFKGKAILDGKYTARGFDMYVRPALRDLNTLREQFPAGSEEERRELDEFVYEEAERYAETYGEELTRYYRAYDVSADFPDAILVLIRQMLSDRSPFRDFVVAITENSQLPLDGGYYDRPLVEALAPYANWRKLTKTDENASAPELDKYKAILAQLQSALEARGDPRGPQAAEGKDEPPPEPTDLDMSLTPAGRIALTLFDKSSTRSFRALISRWLDDVGIQGFLREPFLAPIREIERMGRRDVEHVVADVWERRMLLSIGGLLRRFPFDMQSDVDATPEDLEMALHPVKGQFFELYRQFVAPITREKGNQFSAIAGLETPKGMYEVIGAVKRLGDELWQPTGEPKPYKIRVSPVPFDNSKDMESVLTLVYLSTGSTSMFNFNQKAYEKTLEIDWTKPSTSQIGIQLTNVNTRRNTYPNPIVAVDSYWSFLRLLRQATAKPPYWSFSFETGEEGGQKIYARFAVEGDPWAPFRLRTQKDKPSPMATTEGDEP